MDPEAAEVKASGGVVWRRRADDGVELVVVHRPALRRLVAAQGQARSRRDAGSRPRCARSTRRSGCAAGSATSCRRCGYRDNKGREKAVRYWLMEPEDGAAPFTPNDEVDEMRWVDSEAAAALLSYPHDAELVRAARSAHMNRERFPGVAGRLGAAGRPGRHADGRRARSTRWRTSCARGDNANHGGAFAAAHATDACVRATPAPRSAGCSAPSRPASRSARR